MNNRTRLDENGNFYCPTCSTHKPREEYHLVSSRKHGIAWRCKSCEYTARQNYHFRKTYGITTEERDALINTQEGKCACCGNEFDSTQRGSPVVDHNHDTNEVRDILCDRCNVVLGMINEDPEVAHNLIDYIHKWTR